MKHRALFATVSVIALAATSAMAGSIYTTTFENFALGGDTTAAPLISDPALTSNNWRGNGSSGLANNGVPGSLYDGEIVDTGTSYGKAYRLSNAKISGNYDSTHAATPTVDAIGETGTNGTLGKFTFSLDFKSVSSTVQDGLSIDVTPFKNNTPNRNGILRILDNETDGLSVGWWGNASGAFEWTSLATGLSRDSWHSVDVEIIVLDGVANDSVAITLDGVSTSGLGTWEGYYRANALSLDAIDSLVFRVASPVDYNTNTGGVPALYDGGIYFDNVTVTPEPATMSLLGLGGIALLRRRRNRK